ncbi:MAG: hypothetical protein M1816_007058 [Peltula sp. TS41687]|nr:MAG: hypothetical protein M1816_007058 [Peltula sp. TS41687]
MAAGIKLSDLSYDLKTLIVSYVRRPTDMKNLCLTCKALREISVRQLYRTVELDVGCEADLKITAFLGRSNPGLEYIRTLLLNPDPEDTSPAPLSLPRTPSPLHQAPPPPPLFAPAPPPVIVQALGNPPLPVVPPPPPPPGMATVGPNITIRVRGVQEEKKKRWRPAHFTVRLLIELLPENILEKFRWSSYDEFSVENFILLCKKQKNLKWIDVGPMKGSLDEVLEKNPDLIKNLQDLHSLDLYPDNQDCLEACHKIIQKTPKLDELWLESPNEPPRPINPHNHNSNNTNNNDPQWDDESNKPGLLTSTLFKDKIPFQTCSTPLNLRLLSLHKINLRWAAQTYMRIISFPNLEELEVRFCPGSDALFAEMAKPAKRPTKLEQLSFAQSNDGRNHQYIQSALETFLLSISKLKRLYINLVEGNNLPKVEAVCNHASTLKSLILESTRYGHGLLPSFMSYRTYAGESFAEICKQCTGLEQLAISCPTTNLFDDQFSDKFTQYIDSILTLPSLTTLHCTSWPEISLHHSAHPPSNHGKLPVKIYEHQIQRLAEEIFERKIRWAKDQAQPNTLRVVAIGNTAKKNRLDGVAGDLDPLVFLQGSLTDPFGETSVVAVEVRTSMVRFVEPVSDILNHLYPEPTAPLSPT